MKVALDGGPLVTGDSVRGIGVYVRELSRQLKEVKVVDVSREDLSKYDIVHFTRFNPFRVSIPYQKPSNTKFVLTIYDLIQLIYPKHYPPGIRGLAKWYVNKFLIKKNIDAIVTISETSKKDICRFIGANPDKVFVTRLAAPEIFRKLAGGSWRKEISEKYKLPPKFALYVGDINYNKNIPVLVEGCRKAGINLVIVGKQAVETERMNLNHSELRHLRGVDWSGVTRLGFINDVDLVKVYNLAGVYIQPSLYEGFSLPPLQAFECKTPLVLSKNQCHVEIFGPEFKYFDPESLESLKATIKNPNLNKNLPRTYSWKKTAEDTQRLYEKLGN